MKYLFPVIFKLATKCGLYISYEIGKEYLFLFPQTKHTIKAWSSLCVREGVIMMGLVTESGRQKVEERRKETKPPMAWAEWEKERGV